MLGADDDEIELKIYKQGQQVFYIGGGEQVEVSPEGIAGRFGSFGEFVLSYEPTRTLRSREPIRGCEGEPWTTTEGILRGTVRFQGERDYVRIEATSVKGKLIHRPAWKCDRPRAGASRSKGADADEGEATLIAYSRRDRVGLWATGSRGDDRELPRTSFFAFGEDVREGVWIARYTYATTKTAGFEFDNSHGTALVTPPAPFTGTGRYLRRPDRPDRWSGSLTAPFLGIGRVRLAGPGFRARLVPESAGFGAG